MSEGGRTGRRRRTGYRTKNKNPTRQCGEIVIVIVIVIVLTSGGVDQP